MEREKQRKIFSKYRQIIARAVFAGISIGAVSLALSGDLEVSPNSSGSKEGIFEQEQEAVPNLDEKILIIAGHKEERFEQPTPSPSPVPLPSPIESSAITSEYMLTESELSKSLYERSGRVTYYGIDDGFGLEDRLGCSGEPFDPYDPTTAARPYSSPFNCGDKVRVCDEDSCIDVIIKDTCPGCDASGMMLDLSYGAMVELTGQAASANVTIEGPVEN